MLMGRRLLGIIHTIVVSGPDVLDSEPTRSRLEQRLLADGFLKEEIEAVFEWFSLPAVREEMLARYHKMLAVEKDDEAPDPSIATIRPDALSFLRALKETGLIDETIEEEVVNQLVLTHHGEVGLEDMKRVVATAIFEHQFNSGDEYYNIFDEEWRLLFN